MSNVGMIEGGENLPLVLKPPNDRVSVGSHADKLDRDLSLVLIVSAERSKDLPHSPNTNSLDNFIGADPFPDPQTSCSVFIPKDRLGRRQVREKCRPRFLLGHQQTVDGDAKRGIPGTGIFQICGTLGRLHLQRLTEYVLYFLPALRR